MQNDNIIDLIHKKIDNEISDEELIILEKQLKKYPEIEKEFEVLNSLTGYFRKNEILPPEELKNDVMTEVRKLQSQRTKPVSPRTSVIETMKTWIKPQTSYPFAVGVLAAVLLMTFIFSSYKSINSLDTNGLRGTIMIDKTQAQTDHLIVHDIPINEAGNSISVAGSDETTIIQFILDTKEQTQVYLTIDQGSFDFIAFERSSDSNGIIETNNNTFSIDQSGKGVYTFFFKNQQRVPSGIHYQVNSGNKTVNDDIIIENK